MHRIHYHLTSLQPYNLPPFLPCLCVQSVTGVPQEILAVVARAAPLMILFMLGYT